MLKIYMNYFKEDNCIVRKSKIKIQKKKEKKRNIRIFRSEKS